MEPPRLADGESDRGFRWNQKITLQKKKREDPILFCFCLDRAGAAAAAR